MLYKIECLRKPVELSAEAAQHLEGGVLYQAVLFSDEFLNALKETEGRMRCMGSLQIDQEKGIIFVGQSGLERVKEVLRDHSVIFDSKRIR